MNAAGMIRKKIGENVLVVSVGFPERALYFIPAHGFFHNSLGSNESYLYFAYNIVEKPVTKLKRR